MAILYRRLEIELAWQSPERLRRGGDPRERGAQADNESGPRAPVGDAGRLDPAGNRQPEGVHQQVAFAPLDPLVRVETPNAAAFRRLH